MAHLFKKSTTRPMPPDAELFTKKGKSFARWTVKGKVRTAPVNDTGRIVTESATWYCKYRTAAGPVVEKSTGCKDKGAAQSRMNTLASDVERVKAGIATESELDVSKKMTGDVSAAITDYTNHMKA